jgi:hypothetical protein
MKNNLIVTGDAGAALPPGLLRKARILIVSR